MLVELHGNNGDSILALPGISLSSRQKEKLLAYVLFIVEGLKTQRLTGEKTAGEIISKQIYDSLYPLQVISFKEEAKVLDLGSGAGIPGIPIKICQPHIRLYLLDANKRKVSFLKKAEEELSLDSLEVLHGRAEELAHCDSHREQYDYVISKAVAGTATLAELCLPFLKIDGSAFLYKGPKGDEEVRLAERAIAICGGQNEESWSYSLPSGERRTLLTIKKITDTPTKYPRTAGKPKKYPLK